MESKTIILSIHPNHINKILLGEKRYEYRKRIPQDINYLIVYATAPTKKVVALIEVDMVMKDTPQNIWDVTQNESGVSYEFFMDYFNKVSTAYAIKFRNIYRLPTPIDITAIDGIKSAPQAYQYVDTSISDLCKKMNVDNIIVMPQISIRFYNDREVRAIWDEEKSKWWFSAVDIVAAITESPRPRVYWGTVKSRLKTKNPQLYSKCIQLKLTAADGKKYATDCFIQDDITELVKAIPSKRSTDFLDWFTYSDNTIDGQSRKKAYSLFESGMLNSLEPGSIKCLQQIHAYLFGGLYEFAGQIRTKNISKGGFTFANALHFSTILPTIENMPETTFDEIADKYVEMNVAHPFMEGNGRSTRIWLDLMFRRSLKKCVDWSKIDKNDYLNAMRKSVVDPSDIKRLLKSALTDKINDRETFMKGIDHSYYYEQEE